MPPDPPRSSAPRSNYISQSIQTKNLGIYGIRAYSASRLKQNGNHLYEIHEDIIFSANQGDSSMEDEDLQAKEINDAYGEIEYSEEVAAFQINEKCTRMISIH